MRKKKILFSGRTKEFFYQQTYGVMLTYKPTGREREALEKGAAWMMDNGAFSGHFRLDNWLRRLDSVKQHKDTCKGIVLPDFVLFKNGSFAGGDWQKTLEMAYRYEPLVRERGLPVAYALQNDHPIEMVPWHLMDCLFIGCSDEFKLSRKVVEIGLEARRRGIWVHHGRVGSRLKIGMTWYADSWDSTGYMYAEKDKRRLAEEGLVIAERKQSLFDTTNRNKSGICLGK